MIQFQGQFFEDGKAKRHSAGIDIDGPRLRIRTEDRDIFVTMDEVELDTPMAGCPIVFNIPGHGRLECAPDALPDHVLRGLMKPTSNLVHQLESRRYFIPSILVFVLFAFLFFKFGGPMIGSTLARYVPDRLAAKFDNLILSQLDRDVFGPSEISEAERSEIVRGLQSPESIRIVFRKGNLIGANAFALSHSTVILTDELVRLLPNKNQLRAVYLHELGHLNERHVLSNMMTTSLFGAISLFLIGDLPGWTESMMTVGWGLLGKSYSRAHESAADAFALKELRIQGISPRCFARALTLLRDQSVKGGEELPKLLRYLSSHPDINARIQVADAAGDPAADCANGSATP